MEKPSSAPPVSPSPKHNNGDAGPVMPNGTSTPRRNTGFMSIRSRRSTTRTDIVHTGERTGTGTSTTTQRHPFSLKRAVTTLLQPPKKLGESPGVFKSIRSIILASWLNVLLVFIPLAWAFNFADKEQHTLIFVFSFLAIIPLAKLLAYATDELSMRVGQTLAGLLNATLGNAVELIVAIIALTKCELTIVQSSLIGSILSNLLLVLGMCFFAGGIKFSEQGFGASATQLNSSLLTISVIAVLLPAAYRFSVAASSPNNQPPESTGQDILQLSHGVAIIMLFIYGSYLFFQLYSHATLYSDHSADIVKSTKYEPRPNKRKSQVPKTEPTSPTSSTSPLANGTDTTHTTSTINADHDVEAGHGFPQPVSTKQEGGVAEAEGEETPQLSLGVTIGLLVVVTVIVAVTAEWLVDSIDGLVSTNPSISKEFIGIILLPIVGNAAEHVTAVSVSVKDKLTLSLGVAVGSSIQIAVFVIPFIVTLGWILGKPLTMLFDPYESVAVFLAVLTVNSAVADSKSNWLEGMILMCLYLILALSFWFYPGASQEFTSFLPQCS